MATVNTTSTKEQPSQKETHNIDCNSENVLVNSEHMTVISIDKIHTVVRQGDKWKLTIGNYQIADDMTSLEECIKEAKVITWEKIANLIEIVLNIEKTQENE